VSSTAFTLDTQRLRLREFRETDAEDLFRLNSDPEVLRYTGDAPFADVHAARRFLRNYDAYERDGFGRWAVTDLASDVFMGFCGLRRDPDSGEVDLAFRLFRRYWASGFATEASRAALQAGFERFGLADITGRAMRENLPSISVLQKLGMKYRKLVEGDGEFWLVYGITREAFDRRLAEAP